MKHELILVSYSTTLLCVETSAPQVQSWERLSRRRDRARNSLDARVPDVTHARVSSDIPIKSVS